MDESQTPGVQNDALSQPADDGGVSPEQLRQHLEQQAYVAAKTYAQKGEQPYANNDWVNYGTYGGYQFKVTSRVHEYPVDDETLANKDAHAVHVDMRPESKGLPAKDGWYERLTDTDNVVNPSIILYDHERPGEVKASPQKHAIAKRVEEGKPRWEDAVEEEVAFVNSAMTALNNQVAA